MCKIIDNRTKLTKNLKSSRLTQFTVTPGAEFNDKSRQTTRIFQYLMVPVGDGTGEVRFASDCGMFIRSGGSSFVLGGLGTRFGVLSLTKDVNRTFTFVDGNRSTQLKEINN